MPDISVIICTHNPRLDYLRRVLGALHAQKLPKEQWELLLIDNASNEPLAKSWDLSWHPNARHIREDKLGLTPARLCGINASSTDLLVFVDDDALLNSNYLEEALKIAADWPMLGAWGGQPTAEFEIPPPDWTMPYWPLIALGRTEVDRWSNQYDGNTNPGGAGMCIRKSIAQKFAARVCLDPKRFQLGRTGKSLMSGEDTDMALTACDMGFGTARFARLGFVHLIPKHRLDLKYLLSLREAMTYSQIILSSFRPNLFSNKTKLRLLADFIRAILARGYERKFRLASFRGEWKARRLLARLT